MQLQRALEKPESQRADLKAKQVFLTLEKNDLLLQLQAGQNIVGIKETRSLKIIHLLKIPAERRTHYSEHCINLKPYAQWMLPEAVI